MYKDFYKMEIEAFGNLPLLKVFFNSKTHKNAWHYLLYGISSHEPFLIVTGDYGMGKTTLCLGLVRMFKKRKKIAYAYIPTPNYGYRNILDEIANRLSIEVSKEDDVKAEALICRHFKEHEKPKSFYIIIDDAHDFDISTLERLRSLSNFNLNGFFPFRFIFFAHSSFLDKLKAPNLMPLDQRFKRRCFLEHFGLKEVKEYVFSRLYKSGARGIPTFTENALNKIYAFSQGVPRLINNLCDACLLIGASKRLMEINAAVVNEAINSVLGKDARTGIEREMLFEPAEVQQIQKPRVAPQKHRDTEQLKLNVSWPTPDDLLQAKKRTQSRKKIVLISSIAVGAILLILLSILIINLFLKIADLTSLQKTPFDAQNTSEIDRPNDMDDYVSEKSINKYRFRSTNKKNSYLTPETGSERFDSYSPKQQQNFTRSPGYKDKIGSRPGYLKERNTGILARSENSDYDQESSYPYSLHLGSYHTLEKAHQTISDYLRSGLDPYLVKVRLKEKGVWWRIYLGHYASYQAAANDKTRLNLSEATVKETAYANLIGVYSSAREMADISRRLKRLGHFPYSIKGTKDIAMLYVGAFATRATAEEHSRQLAGSGIKNRVVNR